MILSLEEAFWGFRLGTEPRTVSPEEKSCDEWQGPVSGDSQCWYLSPG